jgi:hypothetical protein
MPQTANIWRPKRWAPHMGMHSPLIFLFCFFPESKSQRALEVRPPTPSSAPKELFMSFAHTILNFQTYRSNIETCSIFTLWKVFLLIFQDFNALLSCFSSFV